MAIIGKIRSQSWLLLVIIGLGILLFILDPSALQTLFGGQQIPSIGKVGDTEVNTQELEQRTQYWADMYATGYNQQISAEQARNIAWQDMVKQEVLMKDIDAVGLRFSDEEFDDLRFGEGAITEFTENFKGENGQFDPERVKFSYSNLYKNNRPVWEAEYRRLKENRLSEKYNTLLSKSLFTNSLDVKDAYDAKNSSVSFNYVMKAFNEIPDSTITVSDSELNSFFSTHKNDVKYKQKAGRDMDVMVFPVLPTPEDIAGLRGDAEQLASQFKSSEKDSLFVVQNSDTRQYTLNSYTKADLDSSLATAVFASAIGDVVGPIEDATSFKLYKIKNTDAKSEATVRHILIKSDPTNEAVKKAKADSILAAIRKGAKFEAMVEKFTEDPGSKATGGKYEWFPKGQMVKEFEDFSFNEPKGKLGVVKTSYGYHIIENMDRRSEPMRSLLELTKTIEPSTSTFDNVYEMANAYLIDHNDPEELRAAAAAEGITLTPAKNVVAGSAAVAGVSDAKELVRWAYAPERSVGDISDPKEAGNNFIIAILTGAKEDGAPKLADVTDQIKAEVLKEKKAKLIKDQLGSYASVDEAAAKLSKTAAAAQSVTLSNPTITGAGREPIIVGNAFAHNVGEVLSPIVGNSGVFVIQVSGKVLANAEAIDMEAEKGALNNTLRNSVGQMNNALNDARGVKNDMARFY
jgi:peptidyl-prolyl cis-trans isomerase D